MPVDNSLRLIVVRHGEAVGNLERQFIGSRDDGLTPLGQMQAAAVAAAFKNHVVAGLFGSPLSRAYSTAQVLAEVLGLAAIRDARLTEQHFGEWEGHLVAEPQAAVVTKGGNRWTDLDVDTAPPGGESLVDVQGRVLDFLLDVRKEFESGDLILVTHVGPIKALICAALGVPLNTSKRLFLTPGSVSLIDWEPYRMVRILNSPISSLL